MIHRVGVEQGLRFEELVEVVADFENRHDLAHGRIGDRAPSPQSLQNGPDVVGEKRPLALRFQMHLRQQALASLVVHQNLGNMMGNGGLFHQIPVGLRQADGASQLARPGCHPQTMRADCFVAARLRYIGGADGHSILIDRGFGNVLRPSHRRFSSRPAKPKPLIRFALKRPYRSSKGTIQGISP